MRTVNGIYVIDEGLATTAGAEEHIARHFHHPDHMKGWEAIGIAGDGADLLVRRLGTGHHTSKPHYGTEPWGPGESRRGVHSIEIHTFADSLGAYIYVVGSTEQGTREGWERANAAFAKVTADLWL